jgi:nucleoside diphosphate kinase
MEGPKFENKNNEKMIESSDIVVNRESGLAMVVIKPDAFKNKDQIIRRLENSGLYVVGTKTRQLSENFVANVMYKDLPAGIQEETIKHFNSGPAEIILVKGGENIVKDIVSLTGEKTDPRECSEDSIRYIFGEHFGRETDDSKKYFRNAIHRAKDENEQKEDLDKFRDISLS